ncbi:hypothetical protein CHO01_22730 [Cellulomonas hominis]|uniref:Uncharacterized protein n=1 Tax=Cellulomonas hominis TaxID=156981 RepID=A0A511FFP7_9CELL|nr:hypothetical protein [Cellulomonas hominis]MBB5474603.1 hypothetical protein [Cellulomonas hominis]NKY05476.1 hypothetical protein [Cellulomonas hominis]GEL47157.1 hypothetical protein CHO01_22730 [Cellulomonas hominis]
MSVLSGCVSAAFATLAYAQSLRLENLNPRPRPTWTRVVAQADRVDATAARSVLDELRGL